MTVLTLWDAFVRRICTLDDWLCMEQFTLDELHALAYMESECNSSTWSYKSRSLVLKDYT